MPGSKLKFVGVALLGTATLGACVVIAHLALIEIGREVVTLRTRSGDGSWKETRLWIVDDGDVSWLHSAGDAWVSRFRGEPIVELRRRGERRRYRSRAVPGPHPRIDRLLLDKYGFADRWVRFLAPCDERTVPVRLELLPR